MKTIAENFDLFRGCFNNLYHQHFKALLRSRLYAIYRVGEELVLRPVKSAKIGGKAFILDSHDFLFLKNLSEDYKYRLMNSPCIESPCSLADLSYDEYIKTYGASREDGKIIFKDPTWGLYVNPSYVSLVDDQYRYKTALRKFDYLSFDKEGHLHNCVNDLMYVMVDSALGVVIGGNAKLLRRSTYWREGEEWEREEWHLNFFTTNIQYTELTQLFENYCEKKYKKDENSRQFYVIPFSDIEKWEVTIRGRNQKLPIHKMYHTFDYDERTSCKNNYPTIYLVGKDGYKQELRDWMF